MTSRLRSYADAVHYLDSFVSYEKSPPPKYCAQTYYNLDRFRALLATLGHPEHALRCIHIAGTDGKGSTAVFLSTLLQACGYRVGLYTSPHLFEYTERIQVSGKPISRRRFTQLVNLLASKPELNASSSGPPRFFSTVFELLTAAAFQYFHDEQVNFAVIETGLGGLLDATNVVEPIASVLTPIDREHHSLLGKTLREIATQKAGIIKAGRPAFTARQRSPVAEVIRDTCRRHQSPLFRLPDYLRVSSVRPSLKGYRFHLHRPRHAALAEVLCPLLGRHQVNNLSLALLLAQYVLDGCPAHPSAPSAQLLAHAQHCLPRLSWPGRAEVHRLGTTTWILDSAHSSQAAHYLRRLLDELFPGRPVHHLLALSRDKDVSSFVQRLVRPDDSISCYQSSHARALDQHELFSLVRRSAPGVPSRLGPGLSHWRPVPSSPEDVYCVSGSLFWIADVKQKLTLPTPPQKKA